MEIESSSQTKQSSLVRTHAGEDTIAQIKADLARADEIAKETAEIAKELRHKLKMAENKALRCEFLEWLHEREAMSCTTSCRGYTMLL
jgi:hypothetical protein